MGGTAVTDTVLANAHKIRESLAAELHSLAQRTEDLGRELAKIDAWIAQWHDFAGVRQIAMPPKAAPLKEGFQSTNGAALSKARRATGNPKKEEVAEATRQIILERGEPISRGDLFKALANRGVAISSETDPEMVLSTMLWRMRDKVVRLKTGGYWLPEKPHPEAAHGPAEIFQ
jgi:hypothetical protein